MRKKIFSLLVLFSIVFSTSTWAAPLTWKYKLEDKGNGEVELVGSVKIDKGWHLYDISVPEDGPNPTLIEIDAIKGATPVGKLKVVNSKLIKEYDKTFEMMLGTYVDQATFVQRLKITDKAKFAIEGAIRAQACNDSECTPPNPYPFNLTAKDLPATVVVAGAADVKIEETVAVPEETVVATVATDSATVTEAEPLSDVSINQLWTPVIKELQDLGAEGSVADKSLLMILFYGMLGGFVALMTPCVWPIIPMTVSFFLKRNKKNRKKAIQDAVLYGAAIIVIYLILGLLITGIFGASALNDLSTNAVFNLLFFGLLIVFAASFLGAFEMVLPSSWTNKIDSKADSTTGIISIFFMAFTLALVSFSCTGPIIGTLLVETASSGALLAPAIGMFGFAFALAIPFTLFAIFPSWLESLPKSGGWLNSVKVVLGFLELALALKFFSVADLAYGWGILDREVFISLWIVIFVLLGLYLLGKLKFAHDDELKHVSVTRLFMAIVPLSFAMYMVPGLWGAPLKSISAFAPPLFTQDFNLYDGAVHAKFDNYEEGMAYARKNNKPVMIDFSGFGCVNCRKMEASVWIDPRVKSILEKDYVLITLMVDDKRKLPEIIEVEENGSKTKLKTIGDKWSYLQRHKFGINSQPYYVTLDTEGKPIGPSYAYNEDVDAYLKFLNIGLTNFRKDKVGE